MVTVPRPASPLARKHPFEPPAAEDAPGGEDQLAEPVAAATRENLKTESASATSPRTTAPRSRKARTDAAEPSEDQSKKKSVGIWMRKADQDRLRAAYRATLGTEGYESFSDFVMRALLKEAAVLERRYNDGKQWTPVSAGSLPTGRPLSND